MTDTNLKILELINENKTLNEISQTIGLSNKQIYSRLVKLRKSGFSFEGKYYYSGEIKYIPINELNHKKNSNEVSIITNSYDKKIEFLAISDLHIGNINERIDVLNRVYEYCSKNNINIILNCGDVIDGKLGISEKKHDTIFEQLDYSIKKYPFDKNILNFICLGNHDASSQIYYGIDYQTVLENRRPDLIPVGYGRSVINIKNDGIILRHPTNQASDKFSKIGDSQSIVLNGHYHNTKYVCGSNTIINVPSLSNIFLSNNYTIAPSALHATLNMSDGYFSNGEFKQIMFIDGKIYVVDTFGGDFRLGKPSKYGKTGQLIKNEEDSNENVFNDAIPKQKKLSQVEKFNKKYNMK